MHHKETVLLETYVKAVNSLIQNRYRDKNILLWLALHKKGWKNTFSRWLNQHLPWKF